MTEAPKRLWHISPYAERTGAGGRWINVSRVGRKWLHMADHAKVDRKTFETEDGFYHGCYYLSPEHAEIIRERAKIISAFHSAIRSYSWRVPKEISNERLVNIAVELGLKL